jgi:hypothetical protein
MTTVAWVSFGGQLTIDSTNLPWWHPLPVPWQSHMSIATPATRPVEHKHTTTPCALSFPCLDRKANRLDCKANFVQLICPQSRSCTELKANQRTDACLQPLLTISLCCQTWRTTRWTVPAGRLILKSRNPQVSTSSELCHLGLSAPPDPSSSKEK